MDILHQHLEILPPFKTSHLNHGYLEGAFKELQQRKWEGRHLDKVMFLSILKTCSRSQKLRKGQWVHMDVVKDGLEPDAFIGNSLVDMYVKCGSIPDARQVFDGLHTLSVVSWTAMISGYAKSGHFKEAFKLHRKMQQQGTIANEVTFLSMLQACAGVGALKQGKEIHTYIINSGYNSKLVVANTIVHMYAECGSLEDARLAFDEISIHNVIAWNALIAGYVQHGPKDEAFKLYVCMEQEGVNPNRITFLAMLSACAALPSMEEGEQLHVDILNGGYELDTELGNALVNMYAKCGSIQIAHQILRKMVKRSVVSWTVVIAGYAQHGCAIEALKLVEHMQHDQVKMDHITFVSILCACSHAGLVDEGYYLFHYIRQDNNIRPTVEHYACMVDLLARAGRLHEAQELIREMPFKPCVDAWRALLGACRIHGNFQVAQFAAKSVIKLKPQDTAAFVMLSNIYAAGCRGKIEPV